ncbi:MAG: DnaJ domain-containing protein [Pyrinomonadaceae bacterium]
METQETKLEVKGNLTRNICAELFAEIAQAEFNGSLRLLNDAHKVIVYFENGRMVFAVSNSRENQLFEILLRENIISKEKLKSIEGFTNDVHLAKRIAEEGILTKRAIDSIFAIRISKIVRTILEWDSGEWEFSPLARIREGIGLETDVRKILRDYSKSIEIKDILDRFRSVTEKFSLMQSGTSFLDLNPTPSEAFVLSRIGEDTLTIDEIRSMCGLDKSEVFGILYSLWLSGVIRRHNWNSIFKPAEILGINEAKLTLTRSAASFEDQQEQARLEEEAARIAKEEEETESEESKEREKANEISLDAYLKRIEEAATHYEMFDVPSDSDIGRIKKIYFSYAKNFHPDLYHKKIDDKKHLQIQKAFTEIARAYDTLKDSDSREVYDFKLRKVIEAAEKKSGGEPIEKDDFQAHKNAQTAADQFETGFNLLMSGDYESSLPYLERAVNLDEDEPRYHAYFGKALSNVKKHRHRAESEMHAAIVLDNRNSEYRMMLAELYLDIGLIVRAKGELNKLLEIRPDNREARALLDRVSGN